MNSRTALLLLPALLLGASAHAQVPGTPSPPQRFGVPQYAGPLGPLISAQSPPEAGGMSQFYKIGVQHYDAGMMADLITRQGAIVVIPPNFVIPSGGPVPSALAGPGVTAVGGPPARPAPAFAPAARPDNRLPDGVQRIYALQSDNSLVIQTSPGVPFNQPTLQEENQEGNYHENQ